MIISADVGLDHTLHGITVFSIVLTMIGFLCLSYDFLDHPHGLLRWLIQVVMPGLMFALIWSIVAFIIPDTIFVGPFSAKDIVTTFAVYGGVIGTFNGLFTHVTDVEPPEQSQIQQLQLFNLSQRGKVTLSKRWSQFWNNRPALRDGLIGFIFASIYWYLITYLIFGYTFYDVNSRLSDYLGFAIVGTVGGIFWRSLRQSSSQSATKPVLFSLSEFIIGLSLWSYIFIIVFAVFALVCVAWNLSMKVSDVVLFATVGIILIGALASGFSHIIFSRKITLAPETIETLSLTSPPILKGGFIGACYRIINGIINRSKFQLSLSSLKADMQGLLFWSVTWLIIWFVLSNDTFRLYNFYSPSWNGSEALLFMILIGTSLTVLVGALALVGVRFIFWLTNRVRLLFLRIPLISSHLPPKSEMIKLTSGSSQSVSIFSVKDGFIGLVSWYEIWFVFGICVFIQLLFIQNLYDDILFLNNYMVALVGTIITVFGIGMVRFIFWWISGYRSSAGNISPPFSERVYFIRLLFWPFVWLSIWLVTIVILWDEIDFYWTNAFFPQALVASAASIPILVACLLVLLSSLFFLWKHRPHLISLSKVFFSSLIHRSKVLSRFRRYLYRITTSFDSKPPIFSVRDSLIGLAFWSIAWFLSETFVQFIFNFVNDLTYNDSFLVPYYLIDGSFFLSRLEVILAAALAGALVGGFYRYFFWWVMHLPKKKLGVFGVILTLVGFSIQLIEPTVQLGRPQSIYGHSAPVSALAWSPDGEKIVSGSFDATVQVWDIVPGGNVLIHKSFSDGVFDVAWSYKTNRIAAGSYDLSMQVWNADTGTPINEIINNTTPVFAVAWSPDGKRIAFTSDNGMVGIWDQRNATINIPDQRLSSTVCDIAWSPNGKLLATANDDGTVRVWNVDTGDLVFTFTGHVGAVTVVAWSPDGKRIASGGTDRTVNTCDGVSKQKHPTPKSNDDTVQVWDATNGKNVFIYHGHSGPINDVAWSHSISSMRIASASSDGTAQVWDAASGRLIVTYGGHFGGVDGIEWSPDDKYIASCGDDKTVQIWDPTSGNHIFSYSTSQSS